MTDRSKKEENSLRKWLLENDTHFDVIVPDQTNEQINLKEKELKSSITAQDIMQVKRILAKLHYGKWFLQPNQQERAFLQSFLDQGLPDYEFSNTVDLSFSSGKDKVHSTLNKINASPIKLSKTILRKAYGLADLQPGAELIAYYGQELTKTEQ